MYKFFLFLHVFSVILYFMFHGGVAAVTFLVKKENDPGRMEAITGVLDFVYPMGYVILGILVATGVILGFLGSWWKYAWIWISIGLLAVIGVIMVVAGGKYYTDNIDPVLDGSSMGNDLGEKTIPQSAMARFLDARMPVILATIGTVGMGLILWLMMFKNF